MMDGKKGEGNMFSLTVSDHIMIAHSIRGAVLAPAQMLHGNTLVVEVEFRSAALDGLNFLIDINLAKTELRRILDVYDYQNLDDLPTLAGQNTTTEFMARHIHGLLAEACRSGRLGDGGRGLSGLKVQLRESPVAWGSYEAPV
jgi:6-pyruvoyl-tetrahydropterin synthase